MGDDDGTLHILETPKNLQRPGKNEKAVIGAFFERETKRLGSTAVRKQDRAKDRKEFEDEQVIRF